MTEQVVNMTSMKQSSKPRCKRCGKILKSKESIERGFGSDCYRLNKLTPDVLTSFRSFKSLEDKVNYVNSLVSPINTITSTLKKNVVAQIWKTDSGYKLQVLEWVSGKRLQKIATWNGRTGMWYVPNKNKTKLYLLLREVFGGKLCILPDGKFWLINEHRQVQHSGSR